jgi:hypothetical protein
MSKTRSSTARLRFLLLFAVSVYEMAAQVPVAEMTRQREQSSFSMEQEIVPIVKPATLSEGALRALEKDADIASCMENENLSPGQLPFSWFIGSQIHLDGPDEIDLIVLPNLTANTCFVGPYTAKFWVLRMTRKGYELALSVHTHGMEVLKRSWKGYRDIETTVSTLHGTTTTLFRFDGKQYALQSQSAKTEVHFETTGLGEMRDEDGTRLPFTAYRASDGIKLTTIYGAFHSPLDAMNYLDKQIAKATEIITRGQTRDTSGKVIAERAEVILPTKTGTAEPVSAVLWTSGANFHEILSASQEDNLQLERKIPN